MKKLMIGLVAAVAMVGCCTQPCNGIKDSGTTYVADALAPYVESGELPGAVCMLYKDGVTETACVGYADVAKKRKITADDVYMQCSQTKGFCGVTIAKLVEDGKLNLDDPVSKYLPEFGTLWVNGGETNGVKTLVWGEPKVPGLAACCVALASVAVKEVLYRWTHAVAKRCNSPATEANAWHHRSDAISSLPVAAAVAAAHFWPSLKWLDAVGAVCVGGFILHVAWRIVKPAFEGLTDANCNEATAEVERIALGVPGVRGVHHVRTRRYGGTIQADLHVQVDRTVSLVDGHAIGHDVKAAVLAAGIGVTDATIHVEPDDH